MMGKSRYAFNREERNYAAILYYMLFRYHRSR